ncbi:MAG: metal-dependent transcriptional regulator [Planctomycetota bacterium]
MQNCLETIYILSRKKKYVRVRDIVNNLGVNKSGISRTIKFLVSKKLVEHEKGEYVELTLLGEEVAEKTYKYHTVLSDFFSQVLNLSNKKATENACRVEHVLGEEAFNKIVQFMSFLYSCPRAGSDWIMRFNKYCDTNLIEMDKCVKCIDRCKSGFVK